MTQTKEDKGRRLASAVGGRGIRLQLLTQAGTSEIPDSVANVVNQITENYKEDTVIGRVLACRIIANAVNANGEFSGHNPEMWNLATSALNYANATGGSAYDVMLKRLVRCTSLPLELAVPHIYSLATFLQSRGVEINYTRLYWDLYNWNNPTRNVPLQWASAFCDLRQESST